MSESLLEGSMILGLVAYVYIVVGGYLWGSLHLSLALKPAAKFYVWFGQISLMAWSLWVMFDGIVQPTLPPSVRLLIVMAGLALLVIIILGIRKAYEIVRSSGQPGETSKEEEKKKKE